AVGRQAEELALCEHAVELAGVVGWRRARSRALALHVDVGWRRIVGPKLASIVDAQTNNEVPWATLGHCENALTDHCQRRKAIAQRHFPESFRWACTPVPIQILFLRYGVARRSEELRPVRVWLARSDMSGANKGNGSNCNIHLAGASPLSPVRGGE